MRTVMRLQASSVRPSDLVLWSRPMSGLCNVVVPHRVSGVTRDGPDHLNVSLIPEWRTVDDDWGSLRLHVHRDSFMGVLR